MTKSAEITGMAVSPQDLTDMLLEDTEPLAVDVGEINDDDEGIVEFVWRRVAQIRAKMNRHKPHRSLARGR